MALKGVAEGEGHFILNGLEFAIDLNVLWVGLGAFTGIEPDEFVGEVADGDLLALLQAPAPEGLQGRAVSRAFADFEGDDFGVEDVGHDLAPDLGFGPAAGGADLGGLDAQLGQPAQAVVHAQRHAFHGRAGEVAGLEGLLVHAEPDAGAVRHVRACARLRNTAAAAGRREPAGTRAASAANFSCDQPKSSRTISVATVTFIVQSSGSQRLVESQNAAISPCGSTTGFSAQA